MTATTTTAPWWRRFVALFLLVTLVAAACGGDDEDDAAAGGGDDTEEADKDTADPAGIIKIGASLLPQGAVAVQWDPIKMITPALPTHAMVYDTLLHAQPDGTYKPGLATKAETVDATTIKVTLREGVKFSDGTPFTAEAVKAGIQRNIDATNNGAFAVELDEVSSITVDDPLNITIKLKKPIAGVFYQLLSRGETMVVSPKAIADGVDLMTKPVGAGAFVLESIDFERSMTLKKSPTYYDAKNVKLAGAQFVHTANTEAIINALRSGSIDVGENLTTDVVKAIEGSDVKVQETVTDSVLFWGTLCKSKPPFNDVRVRQAMNFGLDRDQLNQVLFSGTSEPMWGVHAKNSKLHDKKLDNYYKRDVAKAKKLLADAGHPNGFDMEMVVPAQGGSTVTATELIQAQWKEIGINVKIVQTANLAQEFFIENKYPLYVFPLQRQGLDKITRTLVPGSIGNICKWDNPALNAVVDEIRSLAADSDEAAVAWKKLERLIVEEAMNILGVFGTVASGWNETRVGGVVLTPSFTGVPFVDLRETFIKKK